MELINQLDFLSLSNLFLILFLAMVVVFPAIVFGAMLFLVFNKGYYPRELKKEREEIIYRAQKQLQEKLLT